MLKDEKAWLEALISRNSAADAYNSVIALEIVKKTKETVKKL